MNRLRRIALALLCLILLGAASLSQTARAESGPFVDTARSYAHQEIDALFYKGNIKGYGNSRFKPLQPITQAENAKFGIDAFMGWSATQYNVGQLSADGSPLMPYWSHIANPMLPAQDSATNSGMVFMNSLSIDPIGSRYITGSSRWTLHPADPYVSNMKADPQLHLASQYLNNAFRNQNTVNYLSLVIGTNWVLRDSSLNATWQDFINRFPKTADMQILGIHKMAKNYKARSVDNNGHSEFNLMFRGSGFTTASGETSPADLRYLWTETATERIILAKRDSESIWSIIDFTDYSRTPVPQLPYTTGGAAEDISYITGRNYKLTPSAPLTADEITRIHTRLDILNFHEAVNYN
jgi:hypothetical protein